MLVFCPVPDAACTVRVGACAFVNAFMCASVAVYLAGVLHSPKYVVNGPMPMQPIRPASTSFSPKLYTVRHRRGCHYISHVVTTAAGRQLFQATSSGARPSRGSTTDPINHIQSDANGTFCHNQSKPTEALRACACKQAEAQLVCGGAFSVTHALRSASVKSEAICMGLNNLAW